MSLHREHEISAEMAFEELVRRHARPVLAYCLRRTSHADAHEAAAEVFAIAWRRFDDIRDREAARTWLLGVARRVLSNQRRGNIRRRRLTERIASIAEAPRSSVESVVVRRVQDREVITALRSLSAKDQEILALVVWDEVDRTDVSALLGISVQAVHKRYQRALGRLERC